MVQIVFLSTPGLVFILLVGRYVVCTIAAAGSWVGGELLAGNLISLKTKGNFISV